MEKKKNNNKPSKKSVKAVTKKVTTKKAKKQPKKKKGFTLIELLAVIIILGILMIVAIPAVTSYINSSRKSTYIDTAKEVVAGARNEVNSGKLQMYSTDTTYYIPASMIKTENGLKSPYGEFKAAYIGVIYNGDSFRYYWISVDETGQGVRNIIDCDKLKEDDIESDITVDEIEMKIRTTGIGNRPAIKIYNQQANVWIDANASDFVSEEGDGSVDTSAPRYVYFVGDFNIDTFAYIGQELPQNAITYNTYQEAMNAFGYDLCTKIKLENNVITEGYVMFKYKGNVYTLKGGENGANYDNNTSILRNAFGANKCGEDESFWCNDFDNKTYASLSLGVDDIIISVDNNGFKQCRIQDDNLIGCSIYW